MIRRPPRSTQGVSSAASDVYKRQYQRRVHGDEKGTPIRFLLKDNLESLDKAGIKKIFLLISGERVEDVIEDIEEEFAISGSNKPCLLYTSPSPRDLSTSRMPSSA
eukprot:TRINITY_DN30478_c0_g2_i1.p1 TRINITY_DN30478_c0_g2~~TRINITY_DN30478_c0_g2_i1.p1  ORF type:complete len:106 (+),score=41.04 TRINITY_DN30478_c0_g2_i1:108-425(+)